MTSRPLTNTTDSSRRMGLCSGEISERESRVDAGVSPYRCVTDAETRATRAAAAAAAAGAAGRRATRAPPPSRPTRWS